MRIMDRDVLEVLKKNMDLAETELQNARSDQMDARLGQFLSAKREYTEFFNAHKDY